MALRNIVKIDEDKCDGCGLCAKACAEGAIRIINGKARLVSETYCDGLGACIGHCPRNAITIEQRQAEPFDEQATERHLKQTATRQQESSFVCPGMMSATLRTNRDSSAVAAGDVSSELAHWPVQLKLVPPDAPYLADARLLLVADCVPFAMGDFHGRFLRGRSIVIGCPKLDDARFYVEKLADILRANKIRGLTVIHMVVPCCRGLTRVAQEALTQSSVKMAFEDVTIGLQGNIERVEKIQPA